MSAGLLPLVTFGRFTDRSIYGGAAMLEGGFTDTLNGPGSGTATFRGKDLMPVGWTQSVDGSDVWAGWWNRRDLAFFQDDQGVIFAWIVEDVECSRGDDVFAGEITLSGRGIGAALDKATVVTDATQPGQLFVGQTRASIFDLLFLAAQGRGEIPILSTGFWGDTEDSHSVAWTDADNVRVRDGGSLLDTVTSFGLATWDWHVGPNGSIDLWQQAGTDRSDEVALSAYAHGSDGSLGSEKISKRDLATVAHGETAGAESSSVETRGSTFGILASYQSLGGVDAMSQISELTKISADQSVLSLERQFSIDPRRPGAGPYRDFNLGDTVLLFGESLLDWDSTPKGKRPARIMGVGWKLGRDGSQDCDLVTDNILAHRRQRFESEQLVAQGDVPVTNQFGVAGSTGTGETDPDTGDPVAPSIAWSPEFSGIFKFIQAGADPFTVGLVDPADSHSDGPLKPFVIRFSDDLYAEADPNNNEWRFKPAVGGFLPGWTLTDVDIGPSTFTGLNTPSSTGTGDGSRLWADTLGGANGITFGIQSIDSGVETEAILAATASLGASLNLQQGGGSASIIASSAGVSWNFGTMVGSPTTFGVLGSPGTGAQASGGTLAGVIAGLVAFGLFSS